jgi:hypothetical protein
MEAMMTQAAEPAVSPSARGQGRKSRKADRSKSDDTVKATIVMDRKLHWVLSSIAGNQGMDGSELAASLIERGLRERHSKLYENLSLFEVKSPPKKEKIAAPVVTDGSVNLPAQMNAPAPSAA